MGKIIITEKQLSLIKKYLKEEIDPSEAYGDTDSLQTVLDGKRGVCFIVDYSNITKQLILKAIKAGLKVIKIPQTDKKTNAHVIYRDGFEDDATKLASISRKNGGYLPINTPEETYTIGILLGYNRDAVKQFVMQKFPNYKFY